MSDMSRIEGAVEPVVWNTEDLVSRGLDALASRDTPGWSLVEERIVAVQATPSEGSSTWMAAGVSVLPAGYSTPPHSHVAEEYAHVIRGDGTITIDGRDFPVRTGDIVLTPAESVHVTTAGAEPLVIWWIYGPAGSEQRWLTR